MSVQHLTRWSMLLGLAVSLVGGSAMAQEKQAPAPAAQDKASTEQKPKQATEVDPLKRELSDKQKKENARKFKKEVGQSYRTWLDQDVAWIIMDEERQAFKALSNDEERDNFIEQFWLRRDPTPDTVENEYKEEHYRRIAYANEHFAAGIPGWRSDRGRIYIMYGRQTRLNRIRPADSTSARRMKAAERLRHFLSRHGAIATWRVSGRKSSSSSWIRASAAITT
jgi:GWxTD domain-containing protein